MHPDSFQYLEGRIDFLMQQCADALKLQGFDE